LEKYYPWFNVKLKDKKKGIGEIIIRAKEKGLLTKGYFKDKKATSGLFHKNYLCTGDLGKFDDFKNLYYVGRKKDAVRVKGENISAWEIETTLNQNKNISESAVMATKSKIGEDDIIALLLTKRSINLRLIANYFFKKFSKNYQPRYWAVIKKFPRTPTFRIDKKNIKINKIKFYDFFENKNVSLK
jgi:crotonobetaine/carnitine-CoA ligase